jgi:uncharacterized protein YjbI with pentapeptide repeats
MPSVGRTRTIAISALAIGPLIAGCTGQSAAPARVTHSTPAARSTTTDGTAPGTAITVSPTTTPFSGCPTLHSSTLVVSPSPRTGVNWSGCSLQSARLQHADFRYADLQRANLGYADLQGADLAGADLSFALLNAADLTDADLQGAKMVITGMEYTNLTGANLDGVQFGGFPPKDAIWSDTVCPDGTNSDADGRTCLYHVG